MNYLYEILAFYDLLQSNKLSTGQIALWHALMHINNKARWAEWFTAPNLTLELLTGLSRQAIIKNRNALKQIGLIDFKSNGTKATSYKMTTMSNSVQDSVQNSVQDSVQNSSTLNKLNKTKKDINNKQHNAHVRAYEVYEQNIGIISHVVLDAIDGYLEDGVEDDMICLAIEEAVVNNKRSWRYINAILTEKLKRGIKTASAYKCDMADWELRKHEREKTKAADSGKWYTGNEPSAEEILGIKETE